MSATDVPPVILDDPDEQTIAPLVGCDVVGLDFHLFGTIDGPLTFKFRVGLPEQLEPYHNPTWSPDGSVGTVFFYTKTFSWDFSVDEFLSIREFKYRATNTADKPCLVIIDFTIIPMPGDVQMPSIPDSNTDLDRNLGTHIFPGQGTGELYLKNQSSSSLPADYNPCDLNTPAHTLILEGNFNVNTPLCIDQALNGTRFRILLTDDARVTITPNGNLSLLNVDVSTCADYLADGIIVAGGFLSATSSSFSGCKNGIRVNNLGRAFITSCDFMDNQVGINLAGTSNVSMGSRPRVRFSGTNRFMTTTNMGVESTVKPALTAPNTSYSRMAHGILAAYGQPFTLSNSSFSRVARGIEAHHTDMRINGTTFIDIHPNEDYARGVAIISTFANYLRYNGTGAIPVMGSTFSDMHTGIHAAYVGDLTVKNIEWMDKTTIGISALRLTNPTVHITDNWMAVRKTGILYRQNPPLLGDGFIANNNIRVVEAPVTGACIALEGGTTATKTNDNLWMQGNTLTMTDSHYGIKSISSDNTIINNNTISITNSNQQDRTCIHLEGSDNTNVDCNLMTRNDGGNNADFETTVGLYSSGSPNSMVTCNNSDDLLTGMQFFDMASNTQVQGNHFGNHHTGLVLGLPGNGDAFIGQQYDPVSDEGNGNVWDNFEDGVPNTNGVLGAFHYSPAPAVWLESWFHVNQSANVMFRPENEQQSWFKPNSTSAYTCQSAICPQGIPNDDGLGQLGHDIADGEFGKIGLDPAVFGKGKQQLYRLLSENPSMISSYPGYSSFMNDESNSTIGAFYQVEQGIGQLWALSSTETAYLSTNRANLKYALDQIDTSPNAANDAMVASENLQGFSETRATQQLSAISYLKSLNNGISVNLSWEQNIKSANALYLKMLGGEAFDATDSLSLLGIARQCPTIGGEGVYVARGLFLSLDGERQFNDDEACRNLGLRESPQQKQVSPTVLSASPNPTMDFMEIKGFKGAPYQYFVTNSLGIVIENGKKSDGYFDVRSYPSGIYALTVTQDGITKTTRFVVSH